MKNELILNKERMERIIDNFINGHIPFTLSVDREWKITASHGFMDDSTFREDIRFVLCHFDLLINFIDRIIIDNEMTKADLSDLEHEQCEKLDKITDLEDVLSEQRVKINKIRYLVNEKRR